MQRFLKIVGNGQRTARDLTVAEAEEAMRHILDGKASPAQVGAFIAALRIKEESVDELTTFARVLRESSKRLDRHDPRVLDVGVPYDGRTRAPSLIPAAALIAAEVGAKIALHGRPGPTTSPKFGVGVGDILAQFGIPTNCTLTEAATVLDTYGVAFVTSEQFASRLEAFNPIRIDYGMRSFFNTIEKLVNPFNADAGLMGVFHGPVLPRLAETMQTLGYRRGIAVQGPEGAIDVLSSRRTNVIQFSESIPTPTQWTIDPADYGWWEKVDDPHGYSAEENALLTRQLLDLPHDNPSVADFQHGALLTAALMILAVDLAPAFPEALDLAKAALNSGGALARLDKLTASIRTIK